MIDLKEKMELLQKAEVISEESIELYYKFMEELKKRGMGGICEETFQMHLLMCMERIHKREQLEDDLQAMRLQLMKNKIYLSALHLFEKIEGQLSVHFNETEQTYIIMHFIRMLERMDENL